MNHFETITLRVIINERDHNQIRLPRTYTDMHILIPNPMPWHYDFIREDILPLLIVKIQSKTTIHTAWINALRH